MKNNFIFAIVLLVIASALVSGCGKHNGDEEGIPSDNEEQPKLLKLSNAEVERRLKDYSLDMDTVANIGEMFTAISGGLGIEIEVESKKISPKTPVNLKNSKESFVIQILETVTTSTGTRYEVRKGKIWIKDAD